MEDKDILLSRTTRLRVFFIWNAASSSSILHFRGKRGLFQYSLDNLYPVVTT